jgi:hypothetical protein
LKDVSCSSIELKYDGPATTTKCLQLDQIGNQTEADVQRIIVHTSSSELVVTYVASKFRTYLPEHPLRHIIESEFFQDTDNWQAEHKYAGFDVAAFNGYDKPGDPPFLCAGFARFSGSPGNYEFDDGPGYKILAEGIYCVSSGAAALTNPVDNFYRIVDGVLEEVHFPP